MKEFYEKLSTLKDHTGEDFDPSNFNQGRVLLVGAGGIGCEVLKNLILMGVYHIDVIDMDVIDVSNLNRQFLFTDTDVGKYKAVVAVERMKKVIAKRGDAAQFVFNAMVHRIQEVPLNQLSSYLCVVTALDNVEARRWVNSALFDLLEYDSEGDINPNTIHCMIDGGSEGVAGQARLIVPGLPIPCYECTMILNEEDHAKRNIPLCTLAFTPRNAEHCIEYARISEWPTCRGDTIFDADDQCHLQWVHDKAIERAKEYKIELFDEFYTMGVLKRIVPAVASTNALVGAFMSNLVLRLVISHATNYEGSVGNLDNYISLVGDTAYMAPVELWQQEDCIVCSPEQRKRRREPVRVVVNTAHMSLRDLLDQIVSCEAFPVHNPSISIAPVNGVDEQIVYLSNPVMAKQFEPRLSQSITELNLIGDALDPSLLIVTDSICPYPIHLYIELKTV